MGWIQRILRQLGALQGQYDYLRTNTMKTLIPKEHKKTYGESFLRFSSEFFPIRQVDGFFPRWFKWVKLHISPYNYVWRTNYVQYTV